MVIAHIVHMIVIPLDRRRSPTASAASRCTSSAPCSRGTWGFFAFPMFDTKSPVVILLAICIGLVIHAFMYAPQPAIMSEMFPTRMRYSGVSLGYQVTSIVAGSLAPIIAAALLQQFGSWVPVAIYLAIAAAITLVAVISLRETKGSSLHELDRIDEERLAEDADAAVGARIAGPHGPGVARCASCVERGAPRASAEPRPVQCRSVARRIAPPGSQSSLREANRARLVESLKRHGRLTQVELAGSTGLSPATVSNIVKELTASGLLHTSFTSRSGRRATLVSLARQLGLVAGVHFSSRQLHIAIADATRTVVTQTSLPLALDHRHDAELDRLSILLGDMMESLGGSRRRPARRRPRAARAHRSAHRHGLDPRAAARLGGRRRRREPDARASGGPVFVDSEANLGGLAEAREGSGARRASSSVFIRVGHTISAGLIVGGDLFRGVNGKAGQIGHVTIDENGPICRCSNRGCLETYAGGPALLSLFPPERGHAAPRRPAAGRRGRRRQRPPRDRRRRPPHRHRRGEPVQPVRPRADHRRRRARRRPARS